MSDLFLVGWILLIGTIFSGIEFDYVINYDLCDPDEYIHRIWHTAHVSSVAAASIGCSISFFDPVNDGDKAGPLVTKLAAVRIISSAIIFSFNPN